jgi:uncharacterized protein (TIGR02231 family)
VPVLDSRIVAVTVFTDRARVTRQGRLAVEAGSHRLEFAGLPAALDPQSVRVAARSVSPVKLLGVDSRKTFQTDLTPGRVQELEARVQTLCDEGAVDDDRKSSLEKHLAHLDGLSEASRLYAYGLANGRTTLEQQAALLTFLEQQRDGLQDRLRALAYRARQRGKELQRLQQELQQGAGNRARQWYAVAVEVAAAAAGEVEVDLTYLLPGASWQPLYDVRLRGADLEVTYFAEVKQQTGEDWAGVGLTLSTARPALAAAVPWLSPWHLHAQFAPVPVAATKGAGGRPAWRAEAPAMMTASMAMDARLSAPAPVEAEVAMAKVERSSGAVTFQVPGSVDVPSDNSPHKTTVGIFRVPPRFEYVAVPKLVEAVFRRAKAVNNSPYTLLPGRAQLFIEDDFLGSTDLKLTAPEQPFELFFGADERLGASRELKKRDVGKTFLGGRRRLHYAYEVFLINHTGATQEMVLVDQLPLPQHEDIKVTLDSAEPKPVRQDDFNTLIWRLTVPDGGRQKVRFEFSVEHPREMTVAGLA